MKKLLVIGLFLIILTPAISQAQIADRAVLQNLLDQLIRLQTIVKQLIARQGNAVPVAPTISWQTYQFKAGDFGQASYLPFEIKYPSSWSYKKMSGNVDYIVFYPKSMQNVLEAGAMITNAPIVLYPTAQDVTGNIAKDSKNHKNFVTSSGEIRAYLNLSDSKYQKEFDEMIKTFVFQTTVNTPLGNDVLKISCGNTGCNTSGVESTRNNFFVKTSDNKYVKVLIDIETRLRYVRGIDSEKPGVIEDVVKWADFYPLIENKPRLGMPFNATIYGDWIDSNTFKANWIKWSIG